jgi:hypothetical protein
MRAEDEGTKESQAAYQVSDHASVLKVIQYLVDESGVRTAAVISLKEWGEL